VYGRPEAFLLLKIVGSHDQRGLGELEVMLVYERKVDGE
jgi:hypothetical protein